jgi:hypothetical protein
MSAMSDYLENKLIDFILRGQSYTPPATMYVGLFTGTPGDASFTEVSGSAYARVAITSSLANWSGTQGSTTTTASSGSSGTSYNNAAVNFPTPTATWGTITAVGLFDASTSGNLLFYGLLDTPKTINTSDTVTFPTSSLGVQVDN